MHSTDNEYCFPVNRTDRVEIVGVLSAPSIHSGPPVILSNIVVCLYRKQKHIREKREFMMTWPDNKSS